jgi:mannose-1-phosphate guanylyltransferase
MEIGAKRADRWAIILAGGEGMRLRPLTRRIAGDERPQQFCPFMDSETFARSDARSRRPDRATGSDLPGPDPPPRAVLCAAPRRGAARAAGRSAVRPGYRTGDSLRFASHRRGGTRGRGRPLPVGHYISDDARFMAHVEAAFAAVEARPDLIALLGMEAAGAEVQYGWIEAGDQLLDGPAYPVYRVRRFWEKTLPLAEALFERGCLWNTSWASPMATSPISRASRPWSSSAAGARSSSSPSGPAGPSG